VYGYTDSSALSTKYGYNAGSAMVGTTDRATAIGSQAGATLSNSPDVTVVGYSAGTRLIGCSQSTVIGSYAVSYSSITSGGATTAIGYSAGRSIQSATGSTFIGSLTGYSGGATTIYSANYNTSIGYSAFISATAATPYVQGACNTSLGAYTLTKIDSGSDNVAVGAYALQNASTGSANTAVGGRYNLTNKTLGAVTTGYQNVAIGAGAGYQIVDGTNNTIIGTNAGTTLTSGSSNIVIGVDAEPSSATITGEATIGGSVITSTRLRGIVQHNAAILEQAVISATAATGTINYDARFQSVLYYTTNASGNWTLNIRGASGVSLDSVMSTGQSMTIAFLATQGATAYYQSALTVDGASVVPKWQGGTAPTSGNASSVDIYVVTIIKTGSATFSAFASQTKFA